MQPGYTPGLRASQHQDAPFLAQITTMNKAIRDALLVLLRTFPGDTQVAAFVRSVSADRTALWEDWKRAVPHELKGTVTKVRRAHHGPAMTHAATLRTDDLKARYRSAATRWRRRAAQLQQSRGGDVVVSRSLQRISEHLDKVDETLGLRESDTARG